MQRSVYASQKEKIIEGKVVIVGDYSENIELNISVRQESQEFYNKPQKSLLYFCVHSKEKKKLFF